MSPAKPSDHERHLRASVYALVAFCLAAAGHLLLGADRVETLGYAAAVYLFLNALNYRAMFGRRQPVESEDESPSRRDTRRR